MHSTSLTSHRMSLDSDTYADQGLILQGLISQADLPSPERAQICADAAALVRKSALIPRRA